MSNIKNKYLEYIKSSSWEEEKITIRQIYENNSWPIACVKCGTNSKLNLHHNYYSSDLENPNLSDLDYLCSICHKQWHIIQKSTKKLQNGLVGLNFYFYNHNKSYLEKEKVSGLLSKKINKDELIISIFFTPSVIKYEEEDRRISKLRLPFILISLPLIFLYGAGLITIWLTFFFIKNKIDKPLLYDTFIRKRRSLENKKEILRALDKGFKEEVKYRNYILQI